MNRADIEREYQVVNGWIMNPGKFEGEAVYVPYFWDAGLNGDGEYEEYGVISFNVTDEDRMEFPELSKVRKVLLFQQDDGFIVSYTSYIDEE